mmetsp:Transcript_71175/g.112750  ORF Transcript_71175/g.112750 Transcript_71175/m.112750 type:complete len:212 (+) Transcript_71175:62-697(+)
MATASWCRWHRLAFFGILLVVSADLLPVDDVPKCVHVIRTSVLVLQIVGVFPHIQTQDWNHLFEAVVQAFHQWIVLIRRGGHLQSPIGGDPQPGPATAEAAQGHLGEGLFEPLQTTEAIVDGRAQICTGLGGTAGAGKIHPKERVIVMSPAVISHCWGCRGRRLLQLREEGCVTFGRSTALGCKCCVQSCHIGSMVLLVMYSHGLLINVRL